MKKQYVSYGILGIVLGLVIGFVVANWTYKSPSANQQTNNGNTASASVNTGGPAAELPPGHPPVDTANPTSAPPLPSESGADTGADASPVASSGESVELPSLDPLPAGNKEKRAEQEYKNIQLLKGLPADRLMPIMFAFKSSLGVDCTHCHIKDQFEKDDKSAKQVARKMIKLVRDTNANLGAGRVNCFTCHRGQPQPPK
ncbi:MAG TPA: photosynthetic reaction center cytochrome c subunit family protein [Blastocatellia bacterium]|nr:photosynthetic reaction center cytochrome c subunit family protein [Blastocatellia bacterium]